MRTPPKRGHVFFLLGSLFFLSLPSELPAASPKYTSLLPIPPRLQWNANYGYCGEVSLISCGLYYGQYCSQYKARSLASPGISQARPSSQLLLGVNDVRAATAMHLETIAWNTARQRNTREFLLWIKSQVLQGHPVAIGLFMNQYLFYGDKTRNAGDPDYDHIVPVTGIGSSYSLTTKANTYYAGDTLYFSDNGLWAPRDVPVYSFSSTFGLFPKSRSGANQAKSPVYSLNNNASNYGLAVTGVKDKDGKTVRVTLTVSPNSEIPALAEGSRNAPTPAQLSLKATVAIPDPSLSYNLYLYDSFEAVPDSGFNAKAGQASQVWHIPANSGTTYAVNLTLSSDKVAVFRAVPTTAP